jgi:hypothetical protein
MPNLSGLLENLSWLIRKSAGQQDIVRLSLAEGKPDKAPCMVSGCRVTTSVLASCLFHRIGATLIFVE